MKLPASLTSSSEWTIVGPMGPEVPQNLLTHSLLGVDGGAHFCSKMDVWVGDGDSYKKNVKCDNIFPFSPQKSISDFALALTLFEASGPMILHCWGFLGGRMDHEILNFGAALNFLEKSPSSQVIFYQKNGKMALKCLGNGEWPFNHHGTFSLACIKNAKVKILGSCLYPLEKDTVLEPLASLGLSNVGQGQFTLFNQGPVMIFFPESA
jgi:thiamine pyrophosphokinase